MDTVEIIKAVVFGVVQGVTEWLPISSTGQFYWMSSSSLI